MARVVSEYPQNHCWTLPIFLGLFESVSELNSPTVCESRYLCLAYESSFHGISEVLATTKGSWNSRSLTRYLGKKGYRGP